MTLIVVSGFVRLVAVQSARHSKEYYGFATEVRYCSNLESCQDPSAYLT